MLSKDRLVSDLAWDQLHATIEKRTGHAPYDIEGAPSFPPYTTAAGRVLQGGHPLPLVHVEKRPADPESNHDEGKLHVSFGEQSAVAGKWGSCSIEESEGRLKLVLEC